MYNDLIEQIAQMRRNFPHISCVHFSSCLAKTELATGDIWRSEATVWLFMFMNNSSLVNDKITRIAAKMHREHLLPLYFIYFKVSFGFPQTRESKSVR